MKKNMMVFALGALSLLSACTSTISKGVKADGSVEELVWPTQEDSWRKEPLRLPSQNVANLRLGLARTNVFTLLDVPHFSEINGAREWNYILQHPNYTPDNPLVCHLKLIYDDENRVSAIYWLEDHCASAFGAKEGMQMNLSSDALFDFDSSTLRAEAQSTLSNLLKNILKLSGERTITITGYTDRLGSEEYNQRLSLARAESVRRYLIAGGVPAGRVYVNGLGAANPVVDCSVGGDRKALIACLQPNRRVEITVAIAKK